MVDGDIGCLSSSATRSNIDLIVMYCSTLVWRQEIYSPIGEALSEAGLEPIGEYISCRHTSVAQYITMRSIFDLVAAEERRPISPATMLWS